VTVNESDTGLPAKSVQVRVYLVDALNTLLVCCWLSLTTSQSQESFIAPVATSTPCTAHVSTLRNTHLMVTTPEGGKKVGVADMLVVPLTPS